MKKRLSAIIVVLVLLSMLTVLATACNKDGFKISFHGGDSAYTITTKGKGTITLPTNPVKEGYTFEGWFFDKEFTSQLLESTYAKTKLKADVSVYAKWTANDNTVIFNSNGGVGEIANQIIKTDAAAALTANTTITKAGYTFAGWATTADGAVVYADGASYTMTAGGITLYAVWTANDNTVIFNSNGGVGEIASIVAKTNAVVSLTANTTITKVGYTFAGWATTADGAVVYSDGASYKMTAGGITLYAVWTANDNAVIFNSNGGVGEIANQIIKTDAAAALTANVFTKTGYTFAGWATTADGAVVYSDGASYTMTAGGITLYAVWTAFTYTVNFNYDGADSDTSVTTMQAIYDTAFTCPAVPTKAGFVFQGWYNGETQITDNNSASIVTLKGENNAVYNLTAKWSASTEGMTFTNDGTSATLTKYTGTAQYVVIPETYNNYPVTAIGESAFREIYSIKSVTLPSSLITIGNYAFFQCYSLEKVVYDDVSHLTTIGDRAFKGNGRLTEFTIPATLTDIGGVVGYNAFVGAGIQKFIIENGNTTFRVENNCLIKDNMVVATCGRLENMIVPSGVTSLGFDAFPQNLKSVIIPASVTELGERAFIEKFYLTSVTFESGSMLTTIGRKAFYRCTALVNFTIPANVTSIKDSTFAGCSVLSSIIIPNKVTSIGMEAFYDCRGLTSITIGSGATSIGEYAFYYCIELTSITLSDSLKSIGQGAFYGCTKLNSIAIPANVTTIGGYPFGMCSELSSIAVDPNNTKYKGIGNCLVDTTTNTLIAGCKTSIIPTDGSVTIIGERAFQDCYGLKSITIPNTVTSIEQHAFFNCIGLTSIIIPSSVKSIGQLAFLRCSELTSITLPSTVTSMGKDIVYGCNKLATINCEAANPGEGKLPAGWDASWKNGCNATVVWGYVAA